MAAAGEQNIETSSENDCKTSTAHSEDKKATCIIVLGMAGSGKTTFVQVSFIFN